MDRRMEGGVLSSLVDSSKEERRTGEEERFEEANGVHVHFDSEGGETEKD